MATLSQIREWYALPLTTLIFRAQATHHKFHDPAGVQLCTLQSIKTGRCPENCAYCPQSAHHETGLADVPLMDADDIITKARQARAGGASRFCMGAAWREVRDGPQFDSVLRAVEGVAAQGLEVCCTLGMLNQSQAEKLKDAGCRVYNHNLDTSREYYPNIITTRCYDDRLKTLENVRAAGLEVCSGGILGMGESVDDRLKMLAELSALEPQPESVPINALVRVEGTPLAKKDPVDVIEFVRIIAVARLALPKSIVRLSAGRTEMSAETQALCFLAGANSIFLGEKLLTTPNPDAEEDFQLLSRLGLHALDPEATRQLQAAACELENAR
ncbi:MAG TPA: biotin synthase BioB [Opitutales bacterium]|jgi:biotin synthase|nr:biotin synthase BioB [Opitutales bacterium]